MDEKLPVLGRSDTSRLLFGLLQMNIRGPEHAAFVARLERAGLRFNRPEGSESTPRAAPDPDAKR